MLCLSIHALLLKCLAVQRITRLRAIGGRIVDLRHCGSIVLFLWKAIPCCSAYAVSPMVTLIFWLRLVM